MSREFIIRINEDDIMQILAMLHGDTEVNLALSNPRFVENDFGHCALVATSILTDDEGELIKFNKRGLVIELEEVKEESELTVEELVFFEEDEEEYLGYR